MELVIVFLIMVLATIFFNRLDDTTDKESDKKTRDEMLKTANMR